MGKIRSPSTFVRACTTGNKKNGFFKKVVAVFRIELCD